MNKPLTAAKVRAVLKKAGLPKSEYHRSGMIRGWGERTVGFWVSVHSFTGAIEVNLKPARSKEDWNESQMAVMVEALDAAGITGNQEYWGLSDVRWKGPTTNNDR